MEQNPQLCSCQKCGTSLPQGTRFCSNCGSPVVFAVPAIPQSKKQVKAFGLPVGCWVAGLSSFVGLFILAAIAAVVSPPPTNPAQDSPKRKAPTSSVQAPSLVTPTPTPLTFQVEYRVVAEKNQRFSATYTNQQGGTEQANDEVATEDYGRLKDGTAIRKWSKKFTALPGSRLYLSVQNNESSGALLVRILIDGDQIRESTASGGYAIASCDYVIPSFDD